MIIYWFSIWTNELEFPSSKDALCQVWLKLAKWFWRRWKMWKVYDNDDDNDGQHQKFWSEKLPWAFGSGELKWTNGILNSLINHITYINSPMGEYWIFSRKLIIKAANLINNILIFTMSEVTGPNGWEREREREREIVFFELTENNKDVVIKTRLK